MGKIVNKIVSFPLIELKKDEIKNKLLNFLKIESTKVLYFFNYNNNLLTKPEVKATYF